MEMEDRIALFNWKNEFLKYSGFDEIDIYTFFEFLFFRNGEMQLQEQGKEHYYDKHYNAIALNLYSGQDGERKGMNIILTQELERIGYLKGASFSITSPLTYIGRNRNAKNARLLYGICIDLDGVGERQIQDVIHQYSTGYTPEPNIIVNSGNGLHLYYLLETPIALFDESKKLLEKLKLVLTECVWTAYTSTIKNKQYQGIFQGFRVPGSKTKFGTIVTAFSRLGNRFHKVVDLVNYGPEHLRLTKEEALFLDKAQYFPDKLTLEEAKRRYPDWYERRVVRGEARGRWHIKRDLYDWWLRRLKEGYEVKVGHRYFCIMTLAMYALKCNVSFDELRQDAIDLVSDFETKSIDDDNHFTREDVEDALKAYQENYVTFPRDTISKITGIHLVPNKRNYQKQIYHLEEARMLRDLRMKRKGRKWDEKNGRKKGSVVLAENSPQAKVVQEWRLVNPSNENKSQCARETGLSRPTVHKWWDC